MRFAAWGYALVPIEPRRPPLSASDGAVELLAPTAEEMVGSLSQTLHRARRVRVFDRTGKIEPARKRRYREPSSLLADLTRTDTLAELASALRLRPDTEIMDWMSWPDLWFEFADDHGLRLATLGLAQPGLVALGPVRRHAAVCARIAYGLVDEALAALDVATVTVELIDL